MQENSELELIAYCKRGDRAAIANLLGRYYSSSLRLARGILRSEEDSQDAVQVAYSSALQHLHSFRGDACFKTWITRIVVNCCLMQLRERRRHASCVYLDDLDGSRGWDSLATQSPSPEKAAWRREITSAIAHAISRLPKAQREVFALSSSGLPMREVAATLGVTVAAAKTRLFRARACVRSHLQPVWSELRADSPLPSRLHRSVAKRTLSTI